MSIEYKKVSIGEVGKDCAGVVHVMDTDVFMSTGGYIKTNMSFFFVNLQYIFTIFLLIFENRLVGL